MTPEQKKLVDRIWGMGSDNLAPVNPPVVGFSNDSDGFYVQYLKNWDEVEAIISQLREEATKAWGSKEWQGLTDEEIDSAYIEAEKKAESAFAVTRRQIVEAIEAKLKEKNNGGT